MQHITEMLSASGGMQSMAGELGISESQAKTGAEALLPAIVGGLKKQAQGQPGGVNGLLSMLGGLGGGSLMDEVLAPRPTNVSQGNDVLGQIFGSKDVSRTVAQNAAGQTGLDAGVLKKMLPMLTMLVAGMLAKQGGASAAASGGIGGALGGLLGGGQRAGQPSGGGLASMLDLDGDGNPLDDIRGMGKGFLR